MNEPKICLNCDRKPRDQTSNYCCYHCPSRKILLFQAQTKWRQTEKGKAAIKRSNDKQKEKRASV